MVDESLTRLRSLSNLISVERKVDRWNFGQLTVSDICTRKNNLLCYKRLAKLDKNIAIDCFYYSFYRITADSCKSFTVPMTTRDKIFQ